MPKGGLKFIPPSRDNSRVRLVSICFIATKPKENENEV